jgi:hypothetical protein
MAYYDIKEHGERVTKVKKILEKCKVIRGKRNLLAFSNCFLKF